MGWRKPKLSQLSFSKSSSHSITHRDYRPSLPFSLYLLLTENLPLKLLYSWDLLLGIDKIMLQRYMILLVTLQGHARGSSRNLHTVG